MISTIIIIVSIILGFITSYFGFNLNTLPMILVGIAFAIAYAIGFVLLFFIILSFITLPISKKKTYTYKDSYRNILRNYCAFFLKLTNCHITYIGKEKLPKDTNFVLVSNHRSNVDSLVIDTLLKEQKLIFVAKKSLFKIPWFGRLIHRLAYLKLERNDPKKDLVEIKRGIDLINNFFN